MGYSSGEQDAIVTREAWDRTREILAHNRQEDDPRDRQGIIAPLKGILRCGHCNCAMMPTYCNKGTKRYYYYQCYQDTKRIVAECPVHQIPSGDVEKLVHLQLRKILTEPGMVAQFAARTGFTPSKIMGFFKEEFWNELTPRRIQPDGATSGGESRRLGRQTGNRIENGGDKIPDGGDRK